MEKIIEEDNGQKCVNCGKFGHVCCYDDGDLSHQERSEVKLKVTVTNFKAEYAGCGSHKIELDIETDREEIKQLLSQIIKLNHLEYLL